MACRSCSNAELKDWGRRSVMRLGLSFAPVVGLISMVTITSDTKVRGLSWTVLSQGYEGLSRRTKDVEDLPERPSHEHKSWAGSSGRGITPDEAS